MYPYHNKIKQRINNGELICVEKTSGEFPVIFHFKTFPFTKPIRERSLWRYKEIMEREDVTVIEKN